MKTKLLHLRNLFCFLILSTTITGLSTAQGFEDFTNFEVTGSAYVNGSFNGNGGIVWNYSSCTGGAAGKTADHRDIIDMPSILFGKSTSKITSGTINNGIGNFKVKLYKGFTGSGNRQVELFINGISKGISIAFDDFQEHIFEVQNINVSGDFVLEIRNIASKQIIIDDIEWTAYSPNMNFPPVIEGISADPNFGNITSDDAVDLIARITDADGIASAVAYWGLSNDNLVNSIPMSHTTGNSYRTDTPIPAHPDGTIVYYKVIATDDSDDNLTTSSPVYDYTVEDVQAMTLPYINNFRNATDFNDAQNKGFALTNLNQETSGGGYLKFNANGELVTPAINFANYDRIFTQFEIATYGGDSGQGIKIYVSEDNGSTYTALGNFYAQGGGNDFLRFAQFIDVSNMNGEHGRIKFELLTSQDTRLIRLRDFVLKEFEGYSYNNGWIPTDPTAGVSTAADDVFVYNTGGSPVILSQDFTVKNLYIGHEAEVNVEKILTLNGDLLNDGTIRFISTETSDGELAAVPSSAKVRGRTEVQRYTGEVRSYRILTSAVTTTSSIHTHWQEGANSNTHNPNPGYGTHITGTTNDQQNGFDATATGNPSMFTLDAASQTYLPIANTDVTMFNAGDPYLILVRGDRSINLNSNTSENETVLRAVGNLVSGNVNKAFSGMTTNKFGMFGNPYQSAVDVSALFSASDNVNSSFYYVYDPNAATNGAYVTVNLNTGSNTSGSDAGKFLQPGQGALFVASGAGTSTIKFRENQKAPGSHALVNRGNMTAGMNQLIAQLFTEDNFVNNKNPHDSFGILFAPHFNSEITTADAPKPTNLNENMGIDNDGMLLSFESRNMPENGDIYQLHTSGYAHTNYVLKLMIEGLEGSQFSLYDAFTGTSTTLTSGTTNYSFEVDRSNAQSLAEDRFMIIVENSLSVNSNSIAGIKLYPNPINNDTFAIQAPSLDGQEVTVSVSDLLGRAIFEDVYSFSGSTATVKIGQEMNSGIYLVKVTVKGESHTFRVIKR